MHNEGDFMMFAIFLLLLILIPTLIAALLLFTGWANKYNPALILEYQHILAPSSLISGIIMLIPLLIGIIIVIMNLWGKIEKHRNKD